MSSIYWIISLISILPLCLTLVMRLGGAKKEKLGSGGGAADASSSSSRTGSGDASSSGQHEGVSCMMMMMMMMMMMALKRYPCSCLGGGTSKNEDFLLLCLSRLVSMAQIKALGTGQSLKGKNLVAFYK